MVPKHLCGLERWSSMEECWLHGCANQTQIPSPTSKPVTALCKPVTLALGAAETGGICWLPVWSTNGFCRLCKEALAERNKAGSDRDI